jgi:cytochrome c1
MKTIGVEHKVKMSRVGNWVIVFIVVVVWFVWFMNKG